MERMAIRGFGAKKIAATLGVPVATTKRWLQRLRSEGEMVSRNIGRPRGAVAGVRLVLVLSVPHRSNCHVCLSSVGPWL